MNDERPNHDHPVMVRLTAPQFSALERAAAAEDRSLASYMRVVLDAHLLERVAA